MVPQTADGGWAAEWNESLIAKTENSVSSVRAFITYVLHLRYR